MGFGKEKKKVCVLVFSVNNIRTYSTFEKAVEAMLRYILDNEHLDQEKIKSLLGQLTSHNAYDTYMILRRYLVDIYKENPSLWELTQLKAFETLMDQ